MATFMPACPVLANGCGKLLNTMGRCEVSALQMTKLVQAPAGHQLRRKDKFYALPKASFTLQGGTNFLIVIALGPCQHGGRFQYHEVIHPVMNRFVQHLVPTVATT